MSIPYELTGRREQKGRTRAALVEATRRLLAEGLTPAVEQAAAEAGVSRTTAYRYFPSQQALLAAAHPEIEAASLLGDEPPADARERFERVIDALIEITLDTEPQLRAMLRLSLESPREDDALVLRRGRAIGWLDEALAPLRDALPEPQLRRLVLAARAACGIESLVWLTDVAGVSRAEAAELMRWSACAVFDQSVPR